ncbi:MAG: hypothetical protein BAJALOKI2v1_1100002 [Promethearchaeota archaeon]|nr:MAG: hypothetical protein BAJALOKI2v1_1100002 [Candidatus Lokiarchaeota archaeon]
MDFSLLDTESEIKVINQLDYFPEVIGNAVNNYDIHLLTDYLLDLAQKFNTFYSSCQVINENKNLEKARLFLIRCVQIIIKTGLEILGIEILKNM